MADDKPQEPEQLPLPDPNERTGRKSKPSDAVRQDPRIPTGRDIAKLGLDPDSVRKFAENLEPNKADDANSFYGLSESDWALGGYYDAPPAADTDTIRETVTDALARVLNRPQTWWERLFSPPGAVGLAVLLYLWHPGIYTVIVGCLAILVTWGYVISGLPGVKDRNGWRVAAFALLAIGLTWFGYHVARTLPGNGQDTLAPQPTIYRNLSLDCSPTAEEIPNPRYRFIYAQQSGDFVVFSNSQINYSEISPMAYRSCTLRNTGPVPVSNIFLRVASKEAPMRGVQYSSWADLKSFRSGFLVVPLIENGGRASIQIWNDLPGKILWFTIEQQCSVDTGEQRESCILAPTGGAPPGYVTPITSLITFRKPTDCLGILSNVAPRYARACLHPTIPPYYKGYHAR